MTFLKQLFKQLALWWAKRRVKKLADKLDSSFIVDIDDLPDVPLDAPLRGDDDETDAFMKGF